MTITADKDQYFFLKNKLIERLFDFFLSLMDNSIVGGGDQLPPGIRHPF